MLHVAPDGVRHLPEADRERVAVAADADVEQLAVGRAGAGRDGGHAPVRRVEAMRAREKYVGVFDEQPMPESLATMCGGTSSSWNADDGRRDRVVAAARAEGRHRPLVVAHGQAQLVGLQRGCRATGFLM
jgi:hypothetical protein